MSVRSIVCAAAAAGLLSGAVQLAATAPASAQGFCENLWYQRNAIYARNGYCFRTARARAVFGPACFPPYGRLSPYEQQQVSQIQAQERYNGCPQ